MEPILYKEYRDKKRKNSAVQPNTSTYITKLTKDSFVSDTLYISFKVIDELGFQVGHYLLDNITSWELKDDKIIMSTSDEINITYYFVSFYDAEIANETLNNFINGV